MRPIAILLAGCGIFLAALPALSVGESRATVINDMHKHYLARFDDLSMVKNGDFGISRVESSKLKAHLRSKGVPHYNDDNWLNSVVIFGNHGKPLDPKTIESRYSRAPSATKAHLKPDYTGWDGIADAQIKLVKGAVEAWNKGDVTAKSVNHGKTYLEVRPIKLSKKECLSCHSGMKVGTPVAAIVYRMTPLVESRLKG